ncbi:hypothetical protein [Brevibacillus panacihumi]|uniref:Uncharacterized protein n=1 Tax=Brevibacillus panacihumi TaxID=497735 RepID=A0A3M8C8X8_9BACL|nr:hypothetical protein [Brevibacillus panacihumi]RNB72170.1 hypothetical protein EDM58_21955 [Brevibacillus panacihumi]
MLNFKDMVQDDLTVFFNPDEHGETHIINGSEIVIVPDQDELQERKANTADPDDGIHDADILFYAKRKDFPGHLDVDSWLSLDGEQYRVATIEKDELMYTITLAATRS